MADARETTLLEALQAGDEDAPAIFAVEGPLAGAPLTHGELRALLAKLGGQLRAAGVERGQRVAIVLPNGPEMAIAFLATAAYATAAPLSPAYTEGEFAFYLEDAGVRALLTLPNDAEAAHAAAGPEVLRLVLEGEGRDLTITLDGQALEPATLDAPEADDVALVLHTSGTTSRPKLVPLTQRNLAASSRNIREWLDAHARGPLPQRDAAVPHPRPDDGGPRLADGRARQWRARPASTPSASSAGSTSSSRAGTRRCRRCTRRSSSAPGATPR